MSDPKPPALRVSKRAVLAIALACFLGVFAAGTLLHHKERPEPEVPAVSKESISLETQYDVAVHEAGHVVISRVCTPETPMSEVYLFVQRTAGTDLLGESSRGKWPGQTTAGWLRGDALTDLAGGASEVVLRGKKEADDDSSDRNHAGTMLLDYCEKVPAECECPKDAAVDGVCKLGDLMASVRGKLYLQTLDLVRLNQKTILELANALYRKPPWADKRLLNAADLDAFFKDHPLAGDCAAPAPKPSRK